jgi:hypothetical protein
VAVLVLLASVPARAQGAGPHATLGLALDDPAHPMAPGKNETLALLVTYAVSQAVGTPAPDPANPDPDAFTNKTHITFSAKQTPSWVDNVTFDPPDVYVQPALQGGNSPATHVRVVLRIDPRATALQKESIVVTAHADKNGAIPDATSESPAINLKPAFVTKVNVTAPASVIVPGGRWTDMPFTLRNLANGEETVKLNVTARPQNSQVEYPLSVVLPRDGSQVVAVKLRVPWTGAESGAVELEATPLSPVADDPPGKPAHADIEVMGQSAVPGAGAGALVSVLGAAALLLRRP